MKPALGRRAWIGDDHADDRGHATMMAEPHRISGRAATYAAEPRPPGRARALSAGMVSLSACSAGGSSGGRLVRCWARPGSSLGERGPARGRPPATAGLAIGAAVPLGDPFGRSYGRAGHWGGPEPTTGPRADYDGGPSDYDRPRSPVTERHGAAARPARGARPGRGEREVWDQDPFTNSDESELPPWAGPSIYATRAGGRRMGPPTEQAQETGPDAVAPESAPRAAATPGPRPGGRRPAAQVEATGLHPVRLGHRRRGDHRGRRGHRRAAQPGRPRAASSTRSSPASSRRCPTPARR